MSALFEITEGTALGKFINNLLILLMILAVASWPITFGVALLLGKPLIAAILTGTSFTGAILVFSVLGWAMIQLLAVGALLLYFMVDFLRTQLKRHGLKLHQWDDL